MPLMIYAYDITPYETELEILGVKEKLLESVEKLIVTLGGDDYEIADKTSSKRYPCVKIISVDTTAAGNTLYGKRCATIDTDDYRVK